MHRWKRFLTETNGTTAVEYAFLLATIILVTVATLGAFGTGVRNIYIIISGAITTPAP